MRFSVTKGAGSCASATAAVVGACESSRSGVDANALLLVLPCGGGGVKEGPPAKEDVPTVAKAGIGEGGEGGGRRVSSWASCAEGVAVTTVGTAVDDDHGKLHPLAHCGHHDADGGGVVEVEEGFAAVFIEKKGEREGKRQTNTEESD